VYECFVPLSTGGTVQIIEDVLALLKAPAPVTLVNTVPSAIRAILESGCIPETARVVNLAGEVLKRDLVERIFANSQVEEVCNLYGPSETTTYSTWISMRRDTGFLGTVGRPIANTQIYILDPRREVVPLQVAGEIYIGGAGVARGYLNRSELTSDRFIPNPFRNEPHARLYRTGDVGRWLCDGTIEYLGRNDHQVKLRGYRIEPEEIEARLLHNPEVTEATVVAREEGNGDKRLVAYISYRDKTGPSVERLRSDLKSVLPEYMVPSAFVILDGLPRMPNGKLDRRALPSPGPGAYLGREYEAPRGEIEQTLAKVWQDLLRVPRIGRHDNFFELGGHSLLATRVIAHISYLLEVDLPLRAIFDDPTIQALGHRVLNEIAGELSMEAS
jgi:acyl-coenzyme A synthetase/AMP-(fatty) acid ligase